MYQSLSYEKFFFQIFCIACNLTFCLCMACFYTQRKNCFKRLLFLNFDSQHQQYLISTLKIKGKKNLVLLFKRTQYVIFSVCSISSSILFSVLKPISVKFF